jgi:hypothetical protein
MAQAFDIPFVVLAIVVSTQKKLPIQWCSERQ